RQPHLASLNAPRAIAHWDEQSRQEIVFRLPEMNALDVFPESGNAPQRTVTWIVILYLLQEPPRDAVSLSRSCGQPAVIAEATFAQPTRKKSLLPGDERAGIERGRAEIDQFAINEVTDFDRSDRRLRNIGDCANTNRPVFASIFVNEDRAAVAIDLTRPIAHAHTNRDAFAVAADVGAPVGLTANPAGPAPVDATEDI